MSNWQLKGSRGSRSPPWSENLQPHRAEAVTAPARDTDPGARAGSCLRAVVVANPKGLLCAPAAMAYSWLVSLALSCTQRLVRHENFVSENPDPAFTRDSHRSLSSLGDRGRCHAVALSPSSSPTDRGRRATPTTVGWGGRLHNAGRPLGYPPRRCRHIKLLRSLGNGQSSCHFSSGVP